MTDAASKMWKAGNWDHGQGQRQMMETALPPPFCGAVDLTQARRHSFESAVRGISGFHPAPWSTAERYGYKLWREI